MKESELYQLVRRNTPSLSWDRLENTLSSGQFDTVVTHPESMLWCEFKIQSKDNVLENFRPSQLAWAYLKLKGGFGSRLTAISTWGPGHPIDVWAFIRSEGPLSRNGVRALKYSELSSKTLKATLPQRLIRLPDNYQRFTSSYKAE